MGWWLAYVPFAPVNSWTDTLRSCVEMGIFSVVYYYRARCEEDELMSDPKYREYAAYIDRHGAIARMKGVLARLRPALSFNA
jgi:hypothetical protein